MHCFALTVNGLLVFQDKEGYSVGRDEGCSMPTVENRIHTPIVMQFLSKEHPVVTCALKAYDDEFSDLTICFNEAINDSKQQMTCIVRMLHQCMEENEVVWCNDLFIHFF